MATPRRTLALLSACLSILTSAPAAHALECKTTLGIACGNPTPGAFATVGEVDCYTFEGRAGEVVDIATRAGEAHLVSPDGITELPFEPNLRSRVAHLTQSGRHTLMLTDEKAISYYLTVNGISATLNGVASCAKSILCGQTLRDRTDVPRDADTFSFAARADEVLTISTFAQSGETECWDLFAPDGSHVGAGSCGFAARALPQTGVYTVRTLRADEGTTETPGQLSDDVGPYSVTLEAISQTFNGLSNGPPTPTCKRQSEGTQAIRCGDRKDGSLEDAGDTDTYTFRVEKTETINIEIRRSNASRVCWSLYGPGGTRVQDNSGNFQECNDEAQVSIDPGIYTIQITGEAGQYRLVLGTCCGDGIVQAERGEECDSTTCCSFQCLLLQPGTVCRPAENDCDVAEICSGRGGECPPDRFRPSSIVCRTTAGPCDTAESCTGTSAICPTDRKSTAVCRAANAACDAAESCNGTSDGCPADQLAIAGIPCRGSQGCDEPGTCTGSSPDCPESPLKPSTAVCRAAAGDCDVAETCTGASPSCPPDAKAMRPCRPSRGQCDAAESCDGISSQCPPDGFIANGTSCNDGQFCSDPDTCQNGTCVGPARCDDRNACTQDGCDSGNQRCENVPITGGSCDDGHFCTVGETCAAGTCGGGTPRDCGGASDQCNTGTCNDTSRACEPQPGNAGGACDDGDACTTGETCQEGHCTGAGRESCDDCNTCTIDRCDTGPGCQHDAVQAFEAFRCVFDRDLLRFSCRGGLQTTCAGEFDARVQKKLSRAESLWAKARTLVRQASAAPTEKKRRKALKKARAKLSAIIAKATRSGADSECTNALSDLAGDAIGRLNSF